MMPFVQLVKKTVLTTALATTALPAAIALAAKELPKIAEGRPWAAPEIGLTLTPPTGWQIQPGHMGKTLVLQPIPTQEKTKALSKPIYNRNISVAVIHEARPIDETEALRLRQKLAADFGQAAGVRDFQIIEHRFINYGQKAEGILLYTAFLLNGFPMSQMHIFLSGSKNSTLLTYTDLADAFQNDEEAMTTAWNAMLSTELVGNAPKRYQSLVYTGLALGLMLLSGFLLGLLRRLSAHKMYQVEEEKLYRDDAGEPEELSSVTCLASALAPAPVQKASRELTDVWNLALSHVSTPLAQARKKRANSAMENVW